MERQNDERVGELGMKVAALKSVWNQQKSFFNCGLAFNLFLENPW